MKKIIDTTINDIVIKNSKFITIMEPFNSIEKFDNIMSDIKLKYKKADHYCYAYITNDVKHCSDDGEPSGTAGNPILNVLEKNHLTNIICIVVRYFGGIKLGAGGLIRAYGKSANEALLKANLINIEEYYTVIIKFSYNDRKKIDNLLSNNSIMNKDFNENIIYEFKLKTLNSELIDSLKLSGASIININRFLL